jgi:hypothetical protein
MDALSLRYNLISLRYNSNVHDFSIFKMADLLKLRNLDTFQVNYIFACLWL